MKVNRVLGFYDSAIMDLDTATTFFVASELSDEQAFEMVQKTPSYKKLNDANLGDTDKGIRGDVGIAIWKLPIELDVSLNAMKRVLA